ncbi:MAG: EamA family transporter RarD [Porticoccaceae bacterium]|nr:EamA family transporter RarD [Porticoccaceae bacterium]
MNSNDQQTRSGLYFALAAFGLWGLFPIYFKAVEQVPSLEILAHRVLWSLLLLLLLIAVTKRWKALFQILGNRRLLGWLFLSAVAIAINWLIFIWAVIDGRILETSLGYFMTPLVNVLVGVLFLSERLRRGQWIAVFLASCGVLWQLWQIGYLPWVALTLAVSFGLYGLLRKKAAVDSLLGLCVETLVLLPAALVYLAWLAQSGELVFAHSHITLDILLLFAGLLTSVPLVCYAAATRRLALSVVGLMQYLTPSISFLLAVFLYGEAFDVNQLVSFGFIWLALAVFSADGLRAHRRCRPNEY